MSATGGTGDGGFSLRVVGLLIAVGVAAFAAAALVGIYADPQTEGTSGDNAYAHSAIGHRAWREILEALGVPVVLSRADSAAKAWEGDGLLVLAQPDSDGDALATLEQMTDTDRVLVVLPKWHGFPDFLNRRWIGDRFLVDRDDVAKVLAAIDAEAELVRSDETPDWRTVAWDVRPTLAAPQLIKSDTISPIVHSDAGVLLGEYEIEGTTVWVLSDPDVINNSGIDEGDNAAFAVAMIDALQPREGAVVFDETIHGFSLSPDLWKALLAFPLNLAVLVGLAALAVLLWAAAGRFGAPLPPRPRLAAGKAMLIANTASLFEYAGSLRDILARYHDASLRDLGRHLHIPRDIEGAALTHWLDQVGAARGTTRSYSAVQAEVLAAIRGPDAPVAYVLRAAARLHGWKQEMMHGHRADPDGLRPGQGAGAQDRRRTGRRA